MPDNDSRSGTSSGESADGSSIMIRRLLVIGAVAIASLGALAVPSSAAQTPTLTNIRTGAHEYYDRVVLDFSGAAPDRTVSYVPQIVQDGSGEPIPMPGNAFLQLGMNPAAAHDDNGNPTYTGPRLFTTPALTNVKAIALAGDFEGHLTIGISMDHKSLYSVSTLTNPTRVVIDIGH
ncbi:hypothetical protein D5S17_01115 [Pseudonocardiaceae bacterium YIM PH 21723]|nr:hypothetical protein D5S17_01115 [Pseudonocardiaceae bacterium YIM PH 21723]